MVNKELLSAVLGVNIKDVYKLESNPNLGKNDIPYSIRGYGDIEWINIYELAHKCKEWVISKGYDILSGGLEAGLHSCYIDYSDKRYTLQMNPLHYEFADTEPEAIFATCQWTLDNKDKS